MQVAHHNLSDLVSKPSDLQMAEWLLANVIEMTSEAVVSVDQRQRVILFNHAAEEMFGYSANEVIGGKLEKLLSVSQVAERFDWSPAPSQGSGALRAGAAQVDIIGLRKSGEEIPVEASISELAHEGEVIWTINLRDVSGRIRAEEALATSEAEMRSLFAAMTDIVVVLDQRGEYLQIAPTNQALLVRPPNELLGRTIHDVLPPEAADKVQRAIDVAIGDQEPVQVEYRLTVRGAAVWFDASVSPLGPDSVFLVARDVTGRIRRKRELEAIASVAESLRTADSVAEMAPIILDQAMSLLDAKGAMLALLDQDTEELIVESARGEMAELIDRDVPPTAGIGGHVVATRERYVSDDVGRDPDLYQTGAWTQQSPAAACVPLLDRRDVTGVLWATRVAPFGPEEVNLLAAIANIAASSLHRMVLFEERGQRLRNLTALQAVSSAISSSLDMQHTLDGLLSRLVGHLGVDAADVLLFDPHTDTLKYVAGLGFESDADVGSPQRVGEGLGGRVAFEQLTLTYSDLGRAQPDVERAVRLARAGFRGYTGLPLVSRGSLKGVLEIFHRDPVPTDDGRLAMLDALSEQVAIAIENAQLFETVTESNANLARAYDATIEGWSRALEQRDSDTEGHTQRVTKLTLRLARVMGVPESDLVHVRRGALLHDIGKLGVPDGILWKNGPLTEEEWVAVRRHPGLAFDLLSPISFLQPALDIPYCHHEKWDGTGYPRKLKGDEIPLAARIFAVVDVFDALTSDRPYRSAWTPERALRHIENQAGSHFDPQVVDVFLEMLRKRN